MQYRKLVWLTAILTLIFVQCKDNETNIEPTVLEMPQVSLTAGRSKSIEISAADEEGDDITFEIIDNPGFLSITNFKQEGNTATATLVISPNEETAHLGNFLPKIKAMDNSGVFSQKEVPIFIKKPIEVVTIYFCGTGITKDWWDASKAMAPDKLSGFWVPELVSTLHHIQKTDKDSIHNYYKHIVDGVGAGVTLPIGNLLAQGFPSDVNNPRGWNTCLDEAKTKLASSMNSSVGDVIVNIVGFSRGAILAMWLARDINTMNRLEAINLICFDPVPGDSNKEPKSIYSLGNKVKTFVGVYAEDERTNFFDPRIPSYSSQDTKAWIFSVPGSHETMVGNSQADGHSIGFYSFVNPNGNFNSDLLANSWITKLISVEILGTMSSGDIMFNWDSSHNKSQFVSNYDKMYAYDYEYMRTVSFIPLSIAAYWDGAYRWCNAVDMVWPFKYYNKPRAVAIIDGNNVVYKALPSQVSTHTGAQAWIKLQELKSSE